MRTIPGAVLVVMIALSVLVLAFAAGGQDEELTVKHPKVKKVVDVQELVTPALMSMEDVLGTAVAQDDDGEMTMVIYVNLEGKNPAKTFRELPREIAGVRATAVVTDPFRAMARKPGTAVSHTARQSAPIQLGTSGGWTYDLANGYCCGGTLGALVSIGGAQYVLSNYHVLEADTVDGGNSRVARDGDPISQPGLIDVRCNANASQSVAYLARRNSLPDSNVDAAIAQVSPGMVRADGAILEIGTISAQTAAARIGQRVKKSGRTTGLTSSRISGLNATLSVQYSNECAGGVAFTKTFTGQIVVSNSGKSFLNAGDSGSLMVEDASTNPRAVGLLFAGSSTAAVANPIGEVLEFLGATLVGK